jgi:hypothetical protein
MDPFHAMATINGSSNEVYTERIEPKLIYVRHMHGT